MAFLTKEEFKDWEARWEHQTAFINTTLTEHGKLLAVFGERFAVRERRREAWATVVRGLIAAAISGIAGLLYHAIRG